MSIEVILMKKQNEKRICKPLRIPKHVVKEIESEAKKKETTFSHVAIERLQHDYNKLTPAILSKLQDIANMATEAVDNPSPELAKNVQKEVESLWKSLK